jgi:hypothetical protein
VQRRQEQIRRTGAVVLVVTQAGAQAMTTFLEAHPLTFSIVSDPGRSIYRAFGLECTSWRTIFSPGVVLRYLRLIFRGWLPLRPCKEEDLLQLGGDFVLDAESRLVYSYRSAEPTDRPTAEALLQLLEKISSSPAGQNLLASDG